jgi:ribonuclease HI
MKLILLRTREADAQNSWSKQTMNDRRDKQASLPGQDATVPVPIILYTDGGCTGNEQLDVSQRVMSTVVSGADGTILVHLIRTDSTNTLAWVQGRIGRKMNDRNAVLEAWSRINLLRRDADLTLHWIPGEQNLAGKFLEGYHITREPQVF